MRPLISLLLLLIIHSTTAQTQHPDFIDGRVLFKFKSTVSIKNLNLKSSTEDTDFLSREFDINDFPQLILAIKGIEVTKLESPSYNTGAPQLQKIFRIYFSNYAKADEVVEKLFALETVEYAEKEVLYKINHTPNDPYYSVNGATQASGNWYHQVVNSEEAWAISKGSNSIKLGIVDNAIHIDHADLTVHTSFDAADNDNDPRPPYGGSLWDHGTHVSGLATASVDNGIGIASLGGNTKLIAIKAAESSTGNLTGALDGVQYAAYYGSDIISLSFGSTQYSQVFQDVVDYYSDVIFFAASGNDSWSLIQYPAALNGVIGVGSVDENKNRSSFSNYNGQGEDWVDICAPGGYSNSGHSLLSTTITSQGGDGYNEKQGTSMSCPFAAGLGALMLSIDPTLTRTEMENCLVSSGQKSVQGSGQLIDAYAALTCVGSTLTSIDNIEIHDQTILAPNPATDVLNVTIKGEMNRAVEARIIDVSGRLITSLSFQNNASINLSTYDKGVYFFILEDGKAFKFVKK